MRDKALTLSDRILDLNSAYLELFKLCLKYLEGPGKNASWEDLKQWRDEKRLLMESLQVLVSKLESSDFSVEERKAM